MSRYDPDHNPTFEGDSLAETMGATLRLVTRLIVAALIATTAMHVIGFVTTIAGAHALLSAGIDIRLNVDAQHLFDAAVDGVKMVGGGLVGYVMDGVLWKPIPKPVTDEPSAAD